MTDTPNKRLVWAREKSGYANATDAANAMGAKLPTYYGHERNALLSKKAAEKYADFYGVSFEWLLIGKGEPIPPKSRGVNRTELSTGMAKESATNTGHNPPTANREETLTDEERQLLEAFRSLPDGQRESALKDLVFLSFKAKRTTKDFRQRRTK